MVRLGWRLCDPAALGAHRGGTAHASGGLRSGQWHCLGWRHDDGDQVFADGARYEASEDLWKLLPVVPIGFAARRAAGVWATADELFLFGGEDASGQTFGDGALWSEAQGWRSVSSDGAPSARSSPVVVETADGFFVFGGSTEYGPAAAAGGLYAPGEDAWTAVPDAPFGSRQDLSAVYEPDSGRVIVWGGRAGQGEPPERSGAVFEPASKHLDSDGRCTHSAGWTLRDLGANDPAYDRALRRGWLLARPTR